jgi:hypothetical protein
MQYRTLDRTGVKVSPLCLGAMNFGGPTGEIDSIEILNTALDDADRPLFDALVHPGNVVSDFHDSTAWMKARISD